MSKTFILWFISVCIVVAAAIYIVLANLTPWQVTIAPGISFETQTGIILIAVFIFGVVVTCIIGSYFGLKAFLRDRSAKSKEAKQLAINDAILKVRGFLAVGDSAKAYQLWNKALKKAPTDIISQIELSKCMEALGDLPSAIKVIEAVRSTNPDNLEALMQASELHLKSGNRTAALDNLALALCHTSTPLICRKARDLSEEIGRINDALEYQERLNQLGETDSKAEARLNFKQLKENSSTYSADEYQAKMKLLAKKYGSKDAYYEWAESLRKEGKVDAAAQIFAEAAKATHDNSFRFKLSEFWLKSGDNERAIAAAKSALNEAENDAKTEATIYLAKLYISLEMNDAAAEILTGISTATTPEQKQQILTLKALLAAKANNSQQALEYLKEVAGTLVTDIR